MTEIPKAKRGRRPRRRGTRMPSTTITASVEEIVTLMLIGDGNASLGTQQSIALMTKSIPEIAALAKQARWIVARAEEGLRSELGYDDSQELEQRDIYKRISDNYWLLVQEFEDHAEAAD